MNAGQAARRRCRGVSPRVGGGALQHRRALRTPDSSKRPVVSRSARGALEQKRFFWQEDLPKACTAHIKESTPPTVDKVAAT